MGTTEGLNGDCLGIVWELGIVYRLGCVCGNLAGLWGHCMENMGNL